MSTQPPTIEHPTFRRPTQSLSGKVAIVTGAGAAGTGLGNGRATALLLAEDGCSVVCVDISLPLAQHTVDMITNEAQSSGQSQSQTPRALALQADVSSEPDCARIVTETITHFGRLDILINGVGIGGTPGTCVDVDMAAFARGMEVNVYSVVQMAKYAIPEMRKNNADQGWRGSIVNIASVAGIRGGTPHILYPASKGTVVQMTRAMAAHHAPELIRVNCVCPGMVYTPMMYAGGMSGEAREARRNRSLLKTEGNAWDVAASVRFLAGDLARWITGVDLVVDAGVTCAVGTDVPREASVSSGT